MSRKKQEAKPEATSAKLSKKSASKSDKPATPAKASKKAAPKTDKAKSERAKHAPVPDATVLSAFDGGKLLTKKELVSACGGDDVAVTKTVNRLRGEGKVVVTGSTRSAVYSKAA